MKKTLFCIIACIIITTLFSQESTDEIPLEKTKSSVDSIDFHNKFQEAFTEILEAAESDFEDVSFDTTEIKINNITYNKIMLDFPQAEYSLYHKSPIPNTEDKYKHTLKIYYKAKKNDNDIFLDNEIYNDLYTQVINEFDAIHKVELNGKWKMKLDDKGFKMLLDKDPSLKIYVKPSGKTGFEIEFDLTEE